MTADIEVTRKEDGSILLHGYKDDVIVHKDLINKLIIAHCEEAKKNLDKIINAPVKNIQWEYESQNHWSPFSLYVSTVIEDAYANEKQIVFEFFYFYFIEISK